MTNDFTETLARTDRFEGKGLVDEPGGQHSYEGILQSTYDSFNKQQGLPLKAVSSITPQEKATLIQEVFIKAPKIDKLPTSISGLVFDHGFQSSPKRAITMLQDIVGTKADGLIGPQTLQAIDTYIEKNGAKALGNQLLNQRSNFLKEIVTTNPALSSMGKGFQNRIDTLRREVVDGDDG